MGLKAVALANDIECMCRWPRRSPCVLDREYCLGWDVRHAPTRAVAAFAAHVPLGHLLRVNVIINRVTAITERSCWPVEVVTRIKLRPPVTTSRRHLILAPFLVHNFPLNGQREIVVADFCEVSLFPNTAINESNLIFGELVDVVCGKVWNDSVGVLARIADDNTFGSARISKSRRSRVHESIAFSRFGLLLNRKQIPRFVETYVVSESGEMIVRARGRAPYTASAASTCVYKGPTTWCGPRRLDSGFDNYDLEDE